MYQKLFVVSGNVQISSELTGHVKNLYKENGDVRFLLPVLAGLGKQEVLEALPKMVKLSPDLCKYINSTEYLACEIHFSLETQGYQVTLCFDLYLRELAFFAHICRVLKTLVRVDEDSSDSYIGFDDFFLFFFSRKVMLIYFFAVLFKFSSLFCLKRSKLHYRTAKVKRS